MGIGIGGDYPLSAVITAEFAPRKHRGRMLATVFFMQPIGALLANLTAVIVVLSLRGRLPEGSMATTCNRECIEVVDTMWRWIVGVGAIPPAFAILLRWWIPESPRYTLEVEMNPDQARKDVKEYFSDYDASPHFSEGMAEPGIVPHDFGEISAISPNTEATLTFGEPTVFKELQLSEPAIALSDGSSDHRVVQKETLSEWWAGFRRYLFEEGNWTDLAATSVTWLILDFAFYFLGVNSPKILSKLWGSGPMTSHPLYDMLLENGYRALIAVSTGAVTGGALFIAMAEWRWHLQLYGFAVLAGLFVVVGVCFVTLLETRYSSAVIVLYALCNLFFNFGRSST
jgi:PHS family inorganic phosphate transporter-like MFS transporter